nr:pre-mRNA-splicing factor 38B-like [Penaeus vannamei]
MAVFDITTQGEKDCWIHAAVKTAECEHKKESKDRERGNTRHAIDYEGNKVKECVCRRERLRAEDNVVCLRHVFNRQQRHVSYTLSSIHIIAAMKRTQQHKHNRANTHSTKKSGADWTQPTEERTKRAETRHQGGNTPAAQQQDADKEEQQHSTGGEAKLADTRSKEKTRAEKQRKRHDTAQLKEKKHTTSTRRQNRQHTQQDESKTEGDRRTDGHGRKNTLNKTTQHKHDKKRQRERPHQHKQNK